MVCDADQLVDDRRRFLAALQMLAHGADRQFRQQELGAANFVAAGATKHQLGEAREAGFHMPGLRRDAVAQSLGPAALQEIIAVIEQQDARFVEMGAHPLRRVERGAQAVAGIERGGDPLLEIEHRA